MSVSRDLDGRGPWHHKRVGFWSEPGCSITQISAERWGAAMEDEGAVRFHGVFPLPMGVEREDRCE